ncbi:glycoside hydrolase family 43 protein [Candidatus Sumerlaeota bacterium]|nr:glycoside hydrolase family 43 protein [Candidatus Sumerlaeota bacterium]
MRKWIVGAIVLVFAGVIFWFFLGSGDSGSAPSSSFLSSFSKEQVYLFTSFRDNGDGLHIAYSEDGLKWTDLNRTFLRPDVGGKLMRDPFILQGPDGVFHLVWTSGWYDKGIGYASSQDLINWSQQRLIPVMQETPGTKNCWAPEIFYDGLKKEYLITWASDVDESASETEAKRVTNNDIYYAVTKDFVTFSQAQPFYAATFNVIDANIIEHSGRYIMAFKGQGGIQLAGAFNVRGPYGLLAPMAIIGGTELVGPGFAKIGDEYILYYMGNGGKTCRASKTLDFDNWTDITSQIQAVSGQTQGSIIKVGKSIADRLMGD